MKKIISRLASLSLCFYLLAALVLWLALGIALARLPGTDSAVHQMNQKLIRDWLLDGQNKDWRILSWFLIFCMLNLFLFINLCLCSATSLWNRFAANRSTKNTYLIIVHVLIALIMFGHLANFMIGYKFSQIKLVPGESFALPEGYAIHLEKVHYELPVEFLEMDPEEAHMKLTRNRFDIKANHVVIRLTRNNGQVAEGRAYLLKPFKTDSLRVTLNRFYLPAASDSAGAILTVAANPIHEVFFLIYALTIAGLAMYTIIQNRPGSIIPSIQKKTDRSPMPGIEN